MKNIIISVLVIIAVGLGVYFIVNRNTDLVKISNDGAGADVLQINDTQIAKNKEESVLGKSVGGYDIKAYHYGTGNTEIIFVGGIHGGYSWNTSLLAFETMDYLKANGVVIPSNVKVTVIPVLNPDGLFKVTGKEGRFLASDVSPSQTVQTSGRFNANNVDLNRNFDCDWQASAKWQNKNVSGGTAPFSEPESIAVKNYIETSKPKAVVVWYSAAGGVYSSSCGGPVSSETSAVTSKFATASGYPAYKSFDFYATTGDLAHWLAKNNTTAISVLLTNHTDTEWAKNEKGIKALLEYYAK